MGAPCRTSTRQEGQGSICVYFRVIHVLEGRVSKGTNNNNVYIRRSVSRRRLKGGTKAGFSLLYSLWKLHYIYLFDQDEKRRGLSNDIHWWNWTQLPWRRGAVDNGKWRMENENEKHEAKKKKRRSGLMFRDHWSQWRKEWRRVLPSSSLLVFHMETQGPPLKISDNISDMSGTIIDLLIYFINDWIASDNGRAACLKK